MLKKVLNTLVSLLVIFGLFATVTPAFASSNGGREVKGNITALDTAASTVTIKPTKGATLVTLKVSATTFIKRNGKKVALAGLQVGDQVEVSYNSSTKVARKIEAKLYLRELSGVIKTIDTTLGEVTVTKSIPAVDVVLKVNETTKYRRAGGAATLTDLQVGDKVEVKYNPITMLASNINAKIYMSELKGILKSVDTVAGTVTVTQFVTNLDVTVSTDALTKVYRNHLLVTLADLLVGDKIEAKYLPATMVASSIEAETYSLEVKGTILSTDLTANTLSITENLTATVVTVNVDATTVIKRNDLVVTLADLVVGDRVEAKYDPTTLLASKIEAE